RQLTGSVTRGAGARDRPSRSPADQESNVLKLTRWCIAHRRRVLIGWLALAVLTTVIAGAAGRHYATNFSLPGTESQRALDLLKKEFPAQSGDVDTIVFHTAN